jgi:hypothetical protein
MENSKSKKSNSRAIAAGPAAAMPGTSRVMVTTDEALILRMIQGQSSRWSRRRFVRLLDSDGEEDQI